MLEAFFTRQRKRNLLVILTAVAAISWGGSYNFVSDQPAQASQATTLGVSDAAKPADASYRYIEPVQPADTTSQAPAATSPDTAKTDTTPQPTPSAAQSTAPVKATPQFYVTQGKTDKIETADSVTYTLHYAITSTSELGSSTITAKLTTDVACDNATTQQTYQYNGQNELTIQCLYSKTTWSALPDTVQFKLDVSSSTAQGGGNLLYRVAK